MNWITRHQASGWLVALGVVVASASPLVEGSAGATVILEMDLNGLVGRADEIVIGTAESSTSRWTTSRRHIVTDTTVAVSQTVHGTPPKRLIVRRLGGTVNGVGMRVAGTVDLQPGTKVLLFVKQRAGHRYVVGMRQGAFRLERTAKGDDVVIEDLGNLTVARQSKSGAGLQLYHAKAARQPEQLNAFVQRIRDTIELCKKTPARCR